jgi:hypothetical protein
MSHTHELTVDGDTYVIIVNGDWSGDAIVRKRVERPPPFHAQIAAAGDSVHIATLPGKLLIACGRQYAIREAVNALYELEDRVSALEKVPKTENLTRPHLCLDCAARIAHAAGSPR